MTAPRPTPRPVSPADLELIRLFPEAGFHPAHLRAQGADGTARRVERVMEALDLSQARWDGNGRIVVPASFAARLAILRAAEEAGFAAVRVQRGRFVNHPRCPYRDAGKALCWEHGYASAWDEMQRSVREDAA